jgi:hypothetical protein
MYSLNLYHLGDNCEPGIIINDILNIKTKTLFMLGVYRFNDIICYLNDNHFEKIYDKNYLEISDTNNVVFHKLYNFQFNHDYKIKDSKIDNYDFIKERFDIKIKNFRDMLVDENNTIFITFSGNVNNLKILDMLEWFDTNKKSFHLIIFTNNSYTLDSSFSKKITIIKLDNSYHNWYKMEKLPKNVLYKEIYDKFINCLTLCNIKNEFPKTFEETGYESLINISYIFH